MGALVCMLEDGTEFEVGTGFDEAERKSLWETAQLARLRGYTIAEVFQGRRIRIKHQPPPGGRLPGQALRFPVFKGWRLD